MTEPYLSINGPEKITEGEHCNYTINLHAWFSDPNTGEIIKISKVVNVRWSFPKKRRYIPTRAQSRDIIKRLIK